MDFSGQYLTWSDYKSLGGTLAEAPFNLLEFEARRRIDIRTQNRLKEIDYSDIPQEVQLCEYKLIDSIQNYANTLNGIANNNGVASENTDGYSVSYVSPTQIKEIIESKNNEFTDIITNDLFGIIVNGEHILYCGVN